MAHHKSQSADLLGLTNPIISTNPHLVGAIGLGPPDATTAAMRLASPGNDPVVDARIHTVVAGSQMHVLSFKIKHGMFAVMIAGIICLLSYEIVFIKGRRDYWLQERSYYSNQRLIALQNLRALRGALDSQVNLTDKRIERGTTHPEEVKLIISLVRNIATSEKMYNYYASREARCRYLASHPWDRSSLEDY